MGRVRGGCQFSWQPVAGPLHVQGKGSIFPTTSLLALQDASRAQLPSCGGQVQTMLLNRKPKPPRGRGCLPPALSALWQGPKQGPCYLSSRVPCSSLSPPPLPKQLWAGGGVLDSCERAAAPLHPHPGLAMAAYKPLGKNLLFALQASWCVFL